MSAGRPALDETFACDIMKGAHNARGFRSRCSSPGLAHGNEAPIRMQVSTPTCSLVATQVLLTHRQLS